MLEVANHITSDSAASHPQIHRDQIDDALGRAHGSAVTGSALSELEQIGDLENVTHLGQADELVSFTLA